MKHGFIRIFASDASHPNKAPFEGILTYFDVASDRPVGGAGGRLVYIPSSVGIPALESLVGMAVNVRSDLSGHAPKKKIGVIEKAWAGDPDEDGAVPVYVSGYLYEKDFPDEVAELRAEQESLGFSYETTDTMGFEMIDAPKPTLYVTQLTFTGAAILYKSKAAYKRTSLAAEEDSMNEDQLKEMMAQMGFGSLEEMFAWFAEFKKAFSADGKYASLSVYLSAMAEKDEKIEALTKEVEALKASLDEAKAQLNASADVNLDMYVKVEDFDAFKTQFVELTEKLAKVEPALAKIEEMRAEAEEKAKYERKSRPTTLLAKYNLDAGEDSDLKALGEKIDQMNIPVIDKIALKMELSKLKR